MIVVVGGHTRNIGKTQLVCEIVAALPELHWTAVKITQFGHAACADDGEDCQCAPSDPAHAYALDEQRQPDTTDSGRYLAAGARESWWLRTRAGLLAEAMPALRGLIGGRRAVILESNSVMQFLRPDLYLFVRDAKVEDYKQSARLFVTLADVVVTPGRWTAAVERVKEKAGERLFPGLAVDIRADS